MRIEPTFSKFSVCRVGVHNSSLVPGLEATSLGFSRLHAFIMAKDNTTSQRPLSK